MLSFRRPILLWLTAAGIAAGQPALTTIQDILYRADGTRYTGTIFINWHSFEAGDTSNIATANVTLPVVNGVLRVRLVPTTNASPGAQYNLTYNSRGRDEFTEVWAVPPSTMPLRVRDVRLSSGVVVGPPPIITPIQIGDVVGLQNELALRPFEGVGFAIGRAAVINQSGQIDGATGDLGDCVRVDGSSGPCGNGGGVLPLFADGEVPSGTVNGTNAVFTLAFTPSPAAGLEMYRNGLLMKQGTDYSLSGKNITFFTASTPQTGDLLVASYRYANPSNPLGTLAAAQVVCSGAGSSTSSTTLTQLGSCTIPGGLLETGDRIEVRFQFSHSGTATAFTGALKWSGTTVLSRTTVAEETAFVGRMEFGVGSTGQTWNAESWGTSLALVASVGSATANATQDLTISFQGQMSGATSDTVVLSNFTVLRYPAQTNP